MNQTSPAFFVRAMQMADNSITPQAAMNIWNQLSSKVDMSQLPADKVVQIANQLVQKSKIQNAGGPNPQQLQSLASVGNKPVQGYADGGEVTDPNQSTDYTDTNVLPNGPLTVPPVNIPQTYLTPDQLAAQNTILNQNQQNLIANPAQDPRVAAALAQQYSDQLNQLPVKNFAANAFAGMANAFGNNAPAAQNKAIQENQINAIKGTTTDLLKTWGDQYKAGIDANKTLQDNLKQNAQFQIDANSSKLDQVKKAAELVPIIQNANARIEWSDPNSTTSQSAQDIAAGTLNKLGYSMDEINHMISGKSAVYINNLLTGIIPNSTAVIQGRANVAKTAAEAGLTGAQTAQTQLGTNLVSNATQGGTTVPAGMNLSISAGGANMAPSPYVTGTQTAAASAQSNDQNQATVAANTGMDQLSSGLLAKSYNQLKAAGPSATGVSQNWLADFTPGEAEKVKSQLHQLVSAEQQYQNAAGVNTIKDVDAEVSRLMKLSAPAFQSEMARLNEQITRQAGMVNARNTYQQQNGSIAGFNPANETNKVYMVNPATGKAVYQQLTPQQIQTLRAKGYRLSTDTQ